MANDRFKEGSPEHLFHTLKRTHRLALDRLMQQLGLANIGQPVILTILSQEADGTIESQKELARRLKLSPTTITVSLKSMERDGYVKKLSNSDDLRCKPISITEKGLEAARLIDYVFEVLDRDMYKGFTSEELMLLANYHKRMIENLESVTLSKPE